MQRGERQTRKYTDQPLKSSGPCPFGHGRLRQQFAWRQEISGCRSNAGSALGRMPIQVYSVCFARCPFQNTSTPFSVHCPSTFRNSSALSQRSSARPCSQSTA